MRSFHLVSLGCAKNLVDSEVILGTLYAHGWHMKEEPEEAEILIINTCGFIQDAVEEAVDEILSLAAVKESAPVPEKHLVVVGCLVQRYKEKLVKELPEVDLFIGTEGPEKIIEMMHQFLGAGGEKIALPPRYLMGSKSPRMISTPPFRSWVKITEGCNNKCAYCMIPMIRGPLRSRTIADVISEVARLEEHGVKELSLVAQDSTAYGKDLLDGTSLEKLLESLLRDTNIPWIRLLYLYPSGVSDKLLDMISNEPRIVPYLDIPMQHVNDKILRAMNRRYNSRDLYNLVERARKRIPDIALRTTFLVGFPGETEEDFLELETFMREVRLDHVGVFSYSNEEGSPSEKLSDQVPEHVRNARRDHLLAVQAELSSENIKKYLGQRIQVLVEGVSEETELLLEGRSKYQAPDVDGVVYINDGNASPGDFVDVLISETAVYDIIGGIIESS